MADMSSKDSPSTVLVTLKIKPEKVARAMELWHEQNAYIDSSEPAGTVKFSTFRKNDAENEYVVVQEYVQTAGAFDVLLADCSA